MFFFSFSGIFVGRPTLRASMAQGLFFGGTGRRAVAHTRPEFPKMPTAPSAFPLLGAPQAPGDKPNLPEGSKSLGGRPPEAVGKSPGTETHSAQTASRQLGRPKCYPAPGDVQSEINLSPKWSGFLFLRFLLVVSLGIYGGWDDPIYTQQGCTNSIFIYCSLGGSPPNSNVMTWKWFRCRGVLVDCFGLFNDISTFYGLFNAEIWCMSTVLLILCIIFKFSLLKSLSIIICIHTVIWYQVFLSNANNLQAILWFKCNYFYLIITICSLCYYSSSIPI